MGPGPGAHSWLNQGTELQAGQWLEGIRGRLGCRRLRFSPPPAAWVHWPLGSRPPHGQAGLCRPRQDTGLLVQEVVPLSGECVVASGSAAGQPSGGCGRRGGWVGHCEATHPHPVRMKGSPLPHEGFLSYSDSQGRVRPAGRRALGPHQELCPLPASHRPLSSSAGPWPLPLLQAAPRVPGQPSSGGGWGSARTLLPCAGQAPVLQPVQGGGEGGGQGLWGRVREAGGSWGGRGLPRHLGPRGQATPQELLGLSQNHPFPMAWLSHSSPGSGWGLDGGGGSGATQCLCKAGRSFLEPGADAELERETGLPEGLGPAWPTGHARACVACDVERGRC